MKTFKNFTALSAIFIVALLLNNSFAQDDCASAVPVADLTGTVCATSAPSLTNFLAGGGCEEGTLDTWFSFVAQGPSATITVSDPIAGWRPEFLVVSTVPASN